MRYFFPVFLAVFVLYGAAHAQSMDFLPQGASAMFSGPQGSQPGQPGVQGTRAIDARFINVDYKVKAKDTTQEGIFNARAEVYEQIKKECAKIKSLLGGGCHIYSLNFNVTAMPSPEPLPPPEPGKVPPMPKMIGEVVAQSVLLLTKE